MSLLSQSIFKVNKLVGKNKIGQIYVFFGNNLDIDIEGQIQDPNELFATEPNSPIFSEIFDKDELTNMQQNNIVPIFVKQSIHFDDTIGVVKLKIFEALGGNVSMDEMYLFCLKTEPISPITLYQNLTQNDRIPLTKLRIEQMTTNIYDKISDDNNKSQKLMCLKYRIEKKIIISTCKSILEETIKNLKGV